MIKYGIIKVNLFSVKIHQHKNIQFPQPCKYIQSLFSNNDTISFKLKVEPEHEQPFFKLRSFYSYTWLCMVK